LVELGHGSVDVPLDHRFVADEAVEDVGLWEDLVVLGLGREELVEAGNDGLAGLAGLLDGFGLEAVGAAQTPVAGGQTLDEELLEGALGLQVFGEGNEEVVVVVVGFVRVLGGQDDLVGEQAVLDGVLGGAGFAFGGPGAGGFFGVGPVGGAFLFGSLFGWHGGFPFGLVHRDAPYVGVRATVAPLL
jgi:hypothetical protein